ncbi:MAG: hypothetical protein WD397_00745 [Wenzhouxiangellaceae bacterium]
MLLQCHLRHATSRTSQQTPSVSHGGTNRTGPGRIPAGTTRDIESKPSHRSRSWSGHALLQRKPTKKGNAEYRRLIFNASRAAGRFRFKPYLERFKDRGVKSAEAYIALGRKLIRIAFSLMKNGEQFDPNRLKTA